MKARRLIIALIALCFTALAVTGTATAKDRNKDRIPDRWEKRYKLSLNKKQGRRDQDRDGLKNRAEYRSKTNPRSADSDGDGTEDGDEGAGTIASYDPVTGELVVNLFGGDTVSGLVTDETEIRCGCKGTDAEYEDEYEDEDHPTLRHGGENSDEDDPGEDESGDGDHSGPGHGDGHHGHGDDRVCSTAELVEGAVVSEAELELTADGLVFEEVELVQRDPGSGG